MTMKTSKNHCRSLGKANCYKYHFQPNFASKIHQYEFSGKPCALCKTQCAQSRKRCKTVSQDKIRIEVITVRFLRSHPECTQLSFVYTKYNLVLERLELRSCKVVPSVPGTKPYKTVGFKQFVLTGYVLQEHMISDIIIYSQEHILIN